VSRVRITVLLQKRSDRALADIPSTNTATNWLLLALTALFFLSGASALIYQVLWLRLLGLVFGVTVYAASTVWASFMAGLAAGSLAAGRLADRVSHPLRWFAATELAIGLSAASTPWMFDLLRDHAFTLLPSDDSSFAHATALRFAVAFAVLVVPTTLMGATLPLVLKSSLSRSTSIGTATGLLYGSNTTGAIAGTLAAGLFLIPRLGMTSTFRIAAAVNVIAALCALAVAAGSPRVAATTEGSFVPIRPVEPRMSSLVRRIVLATFTLSGAAALALEVIWLRAAVIIVGPTVYATSILLATVLFGIAAGSYLAAPWLRRARSWVLPLALLEGAIAISGVLSMDLLTRTSAVVGLLPSWLAAVLPPYLVPVAVASVLVALPTSFLMGIAFPIGLQLWAGPDQGFDPSHTASRVGVFYALNVCGGIAGSLLAGFVLLPVLGSRISIVVVSVVALVSALALIAVSPQRGVRRGAIAAVAVVLFAIAARVVPEPAQSLLAQRHPNEPMIWLEEGVQTTASVHTFLGGRRRVMYLDGYHQAGDDGGNLGVHYKIGTLPLALHPNPHTALIVGLGGGSTAGALSRHARLEVDVVELSDTVVRAADFFRRTNFDVLRRPNVHLRVDDGRNYLATTRRRYDIITADTIQPVRAGAANLYSAEYFTLVRDALNDDGLALQWFAGTEAEYRLVARTFSQVFPFVTLWDDGTLMVGTKHPLKLSPSDFDWKLDVPELREALASIGIRSFDDVHRLYRAGSDDLRSFLGPGPVLTDDRPILEYFLALPRDRSLDLTRLRRDPREISDVPEVNSPGPDPAR
jgi:spermidine synthase